MKTEQKPGGRHSAVKKKPFVRKVVWSDRRERGEKWYRQHRRGGRKHKDRRHPPLMNWDLEVVNGTGGGRFHKGLLVPIVANDDVGRRRFIRWTTASHDDVRLGTAFDWDVPSAFDVFEPESRETHVLTIKKFMQATALFADFWHLTVIDGEGTGWHRAGVHNAIPTQPEGAGVFLRWEWWNDDDPETVHTDNATILGVLLLEHDVTARSIWQGGGPPAGATYTVLPSGWCGFRTGPIAGYTNSGGSVIWHWGRKTNWEAGDMAMHQSYGNGGLALAHADNNLVPNQDPANWQVLPDSSFPILDPWIGADTKTMYLKCRVETIVNGVHTQDVTVEVGPHSLANQNASRIGTDARLLVAGAHNYPVWTGADGVVTNTGDVWEMASTLPYPPFTTRLQRVTLSMPVTPADRAAEALAGLYTLQPGQHVTVGNGQGPQ